MCPELDNSYGRFINIVDDETGLAIFYRLHILFILKILLLFSSACRVELAYTRTLTQESKAKNSIMAEGVFGINQRAKAIALTAAWFFCWILFTASDIGSAERLLKTVEPGHIVEKEMRQGFIVRLVHFLWQSGKSSYQHVWPVSSKIV